MSIRQRLALFSVIFLMTSGLMIGTPSALGQDLQLEATLTNAEIRSNSSETTTATFALENVTSTAVSSATVSVDVPAGLTVEGSSVSSGSFNSGTWSLPVPGNSSENLELEVSLTEAVVQPLSAELTSSSPTDSDGARDSVDVVPVPYGSGTALTLNGTYGYVDTGAGGDALGLVNESFTIEAWFQLESVNSSEGSNYRTILGMESGGTNSWLHLVVTQNRGLKFGFYFNDLSTGSGLVELGTWHHATFVYDANSGARSIYLDGERVASDVSSSDFQGINQVYIGSYNFGNEFDGSIDQVRVWENALSADQIRSRSHRTIDLNQSLSDELVAAYRFDAGSGTTAYDVVGGHHGTVVGSQQWASYSGARVGRQSDVLANGENGSIGPTGGTVDISNVSTASGSDDSDSDSLVVYQYGRTDGSPLTSSTAGEDFSEVSPDVSKRLHAVWGFREIGSVTADVTLDYSNLSGLSTAQNVRLLKREGPGAAWENVSGDWTWDSQNQTFTKTGVRSYSQYAIGEASTPLPVELVRFEGTLVENGVRLDWHTATETNNAEFVVQRTIDDDSAVQAWTRVGSVDGAGTTEEPQRYRLTDRELSYEAETLRYRLKQVDVDGSVAYSDPITVERDAVQSLQLLGTAPNPARNQVTVRYAVPETAEHSSASLHLYDILGRQVRSVRSSTTPGRHSAQIAVSDLAGGVYFLRLRVGESVKSKRLTVIR